MVAGNGLRWRHDDGWPWFAVKVVVSLENRFRRDADGAIWSETGYAQAYWNRYLDVFDEVVVLARVGDGPVGSDWERVDGPRISFAALPAYRGPLQYVLAVREVARVARLAVDGTAAVIMRVPSPIAASVTPILEPTGFPYALEVVGDPYNVYSPGAVRHPLRPIFRWWFTRQLRRQAAGASAVAYVTRESLQRRYPAPPDAFTTSYSSIHLPPSVVVSTPRPLAPTPQPVRLLTVGSLAQMYKGVDVLLNAVRVCVDRGLDLRLVIVGQGRHRPELEDQMRSLGLAERVAFVGRLSAHDLIGQFDAADLFALASRTEGLPQVIIEAMARGVPCIGTMAGGIPELLTADDLVPPGDHHALANKIAEVAGDPARMARMSERNLLEAAQYLDEALRGRRIAFYQELQGRTQAWLRASTARRGEDASGL